MTIHSDHKISFCCLLLCVVIIFSLVSCKSNTSLERGEIQIDPHRERIVNTIPQWVAESDLNCPLFVLSSPDIEAFNEYAQKNFPNYCEPYWTQEQSDTVYLGQGIELFQLDNNTQINHIIFYPIILNGVIVAGYEVYELLDSHDMGMQSVLFINNELNAIMSMTSEDAPLTLGYNNGNIIGIIGDTYYVLDTDHMDGREIDAREIPSIEMGNYAIVNAMEPFCTERTARVDDWVMYDRNRPSEDSGRALSSAASFSFQNKDRKASA